MTRKIGGEERGRQDTKTDCVQAKVIREIARKCVYIIRGCLREEEWQDAEEEFARIITNALNS